MATALLLSGRRGRRLPLPLPLLLRSSPPSPSPSLLPAAVPLAAIRPRRLHGRPRPRPPTSPLVCESSSSSWSPSAAAAETLRRGLATAIADDEEQKRGRLASAPPAEVGTSAGRRGRWGDHVDDEGIAEGQNSKLTDGYDFGEPTETELEQWHREKEEEFVRLSTETDRLLGLSLDEGATEEVLALMRDWNAFLRTFDSEMRSMNEFRRKHPQYPPSEFATSTTYGAAERTEALLDHLLDSDANKAPSLGFRRKRSPEAVVGAYQLTTLAWSNALHPKGGERCEEVLRRYTEDFGGDMEFLPTADAYKTVQKAHFKSCSSYSPSVEGPSPGERALGVATVLEDAYRAGDLFLKPDAELHSLTISAVRNTLLDWRLRRRLKRREAREMERDLAAGLLEAFGRMEGMLEGELGAAEEGAGVAARRLTKWRFAIRAYADVAAVVARIPLGDEENSAVGVLEKLERLVSTNASQIRYCAKEARGGDEDAKDAVEDITKSIEEAYVSAIRSGLILSGEGGDGGKSFSGFDDVLSNATSSQGIFARMRERARRARSTESILFPPPTPRTYEALAECWSECLRKDYSTPEANAVMAKLEEMPHLKAESLLKQLERECAAQPINGSSIYPTVVWAWGQVLGWPAVYSNHRHDFFFAANAMEELINRALDREANGFVYFSSSGAVTKMYNSLFLLNSRLKNGGERAAKNALRLLDDMGRRRERSEGAAGPRPDAYTFALILRTVSGGGVRSPAAKARAVVDRMKDFGMEPSEKHCLLLIGAYSQDKNGADLVGVEAVLRRVRERYYEDKSVKPTAAIYTACISALGGGIDSKVLCNSSRAMELFEESKALYNETKDEAFRPDTMLYNAVVFAVSKSNPRSGSAITNAIELLDSMEMDFDTGVSDVFPDRYAYAKLLRTISRSKVDDAVRLSEGLMERMDMRSRRLGDKSLLPDAYAYTTLFQIFARSQRPDAVERAQKWFQVMKMQYEDGDAKAKPNAVAHTALINCWKFSERNEAGEEAEKILSSMETKYMDGDSTLKPDAMVYASVIDTWARTKSPDKAERAWNVYQRMKRHYRDGTIASKPDIVILNSIIQACRYTRGSRAEKERALQVLLKCLGELKAASFFSPDSLTYGSLLNAVRGLVPDSAERRRLSAAIFELCCRNGQVDETVLDTLERVQPELHRKLQHPLPSKWKQNA